MLHQTMGGYDSPQHKLDARTVMKMSVITCSIHVADADMSVCNESHGWQPRIGGICSWADGFCPLTFLSGK